MNHDAGGDQMALCPRRPPSAPPLEDEDLLGEILLRLSPLPSSLPRASFVSKPWGRVAADPAFCRRFVTHHRRPPVLGFFEKHGEELVFTSTLKPPDRIPRERFSLRPAGYGDTCLLVKDGGKFVMFGSWIMLGCRHGRVLIISEWWPMLIVFHPVSGDRRVVMRSGFIQCVDNPNGAVLCTAREDQGHVHGDCHLSPFKVVMVGTARNLPAVARVYSSETGEWGKHIWMTEPCVGKLNRLPGTLVGNVLYWWLDESDNGILEFDLHSQRLAVIKGPSSADIKCGNSRIIRREDGGVGLAVISYPSFKIWKRKVTSQGVASWVPEKTVGMHKIIGLPVRIRIGTEAIVGYSEDANAVFISVSSGSHPFAFTVQLESMQSKRIKQRFLENSCHPFADFYTAGTVRVGSIVPSIEAPQ